MAIDLSNQQSLVCNMHFVGEHEEAVAQINPVFGKVILEGSVTN